MLDVEIDGIKEVLVNNNFTLCLVDSSFTSPCGLGDQNSHSVCPCTCRKRRLTKGYKLSYTIDLSHAWPSCMQWGVWVRDSWALGCPGCINQTRRPQSHVAKCDWGTCGQITPKVSSDVKLEAEPRWLCKGSQGQVRLGQVKLVWLHPCAPLCTFGNAHLSHTWHHGFAVYEFGQCILVQVIHCSKGGWVFLKNQRHPWEEILSYSHSRKTDLPVRHFSPFSTWLSVLFFFFSPS